MTSNASTGMACISGMGLTCCEMRTECRINGTRGCDYGALPGLSSTEAALASHHLGEIYTDMYRQDSICLDPCCPEGYCGAYLPRVRIRLVALHWEQHMH